MPKNKFQVTYLKQKQKTFMKPRLVRNVVGKKVDKKKVRHAFVDNAGNIDSQKCTSLEQAKRRFEKFNILNVAKAVFFDANGIEHVVYDRYAASMDESNQPENETL